MLIAAWRVLTCAMHRVAGVNVNLHWRQRDSRVCFDQQRRRQVVADVVFVGQLKQIFLAFGLTSVPKLAEIVRQQNKRRSTLHATFATQLTKGLDQFLQGHAIIVQKPPHRLRSGRRFANLWQVSRSMSRTCCSAHMSPHQFCVSLLQACFQADFNPIQQPLPNPKTCVDTNAQRESEYGRGHLCDFEI